MGSRYEKGKTNLDFIEARDSDWQWHQLGHMQVCTFLQTDNHASAPPVSFLQAGCPSCRPTNSVNALKAQDFNILILIAIFSNSLNAWCKRKRYWLLCIGWFYHSINCIFFFAKKTVALWARCQLYGGCSNTYYHIWSAHDPSSHRHAVCGCVVARFLDGLSWQSNFLTPKHALLVL